MNQELSRVRDPSESIDSFIDIYNDYDYNGDDDNKIQSNRNPHHMKNLLLSSSSLSFIELNMIFYFYLWCMFINAIIFFMEIFIYKRLLLCKKIIHTFKISFTNLL